MSDTPTLSGDIMVLAMAIDKRSARVAELLRGLNQCASLEEVKMIYSEALLENGFVRSEAIKLVAWCRVAGAVGEIPSDRVAVPWLQQAGVDEVLGRPAENRLQPELVLENDHERERMIASLHRVKDHSIDTEENEDE